MKIGTTGSASQEYAAQRGADGAATVQAQATVKATAKQEIKTDTKPETTTNGSSQDNQQPEFSEEWMKKSIEQANKSLAQHNRFIERDVHPITHTVMYKVMDSNTKEVIAEYPPKKIQDMVAKMWELAGLFVDEKA